MDADGYVDSLRHIAMDGVFNPYRDICPENDKLDAAEVRCSNLRLYFKALEVHGVDSLWLGRDCGYRGARRTGIALTDEIHLGDLARTLDVRGFAQATTGEPAKERTAAEVWKALGPISESVVLWNAFPFHPYGPDDPFSNRPHSRKELASCSDLLVTLIEWLRPKKIVALGAGAHFAAEALGYAALRVRHPSYGGHIEFASAIRSIYGSLDNPIT